MEAIIHSSPIGIASVDKHFRFLEVNPAYAAITGYSAPELVGRPWTQIGLPDPRHDQPGGAPVASVAPSEPWQVKHRSGTLVDVQHTAIPIVEDGGGYYSLLVDLTDVKRAEAALIRSERLATLGRLAAGIVHEVRNPLTAIQGMLQLIPTAKDPQQNLQLMQDEVTRMNLLLSELLALGAPSDLVFLPRDVKEKIEDVLRLLRTEIMRKRVSVKKCFEDVPDVECEPNQLKQVLMNVLQNAIEALDPGGEVFVRLEREDDERVHISVSDTGAGIPSDILAQVGEPFLTTKEMGTGLGLMVSKKIVENHSGILDIASVEGCGTTVTIILPIKQGAAPGLAG